MEQSRHQSNTHILERAPVTPHGAQRRTAFRERTDEGVVRPSSLAADPKRTALIIELSGPAAAGKTTLARTLAEALDARGIAVRTVSSARPAEHLASHGRKLPSALSVLTAPIARASKIFSALGTLMPGAPNDPAATELMRVLPPGGWIRALRLRHYQMQLNSSWRMARASEGVVIFDQGFLVLLSSLALRSNSIDRRALARGLALIPKPDLIVHLEAPLATLESRLHRRLSRQTWLERLFENKIELCRRQSELALTLESMLVESGQHQMRVSCLDRTGLANAVDAIMTEILARERTAGAESRVMVAGGKT